MSCSLASWSARAAGMQSLRGASVPSLCCFSRVLLLLVLLLHLPIHPARSERRLGGRRKSKGGRDADKALKATEFISDAEKKIYTSDYRSIYHGRLEGRDPSPRCCSTGTDCTSKYPGKRFAFVTSIRSNEYLPLLKELHCSVKKTNPNTPLLVMTVAGDLLPNATEAVIKLIGANNVLEIEDIRYRNKYKSRFALNWIKLRLWNMTDWDGLVWLDTDMTVLDNLEHLFQFPTAYAATPDMNKPHTLGHPLGRTQGGLFFVRPCPAILIHMLKLINEHSSLQFKQSSAEQSFLDWYFKFDRVMLPLEYNAISNRLPQTGWVTWAGVPIKVVHHTADKPFNGRNESIASHRFLCNP